MIFQHGRTGQLRGPLLSGVENTYDMWELSLKCATACCANSLGHDLFLTLSEKHDENFYGGSHHAAYSILDG